MPDQQGSKYSRFPNMPGLGTWHGCEYMKVTQGAEYA